MSVAHLSHNIYTLPAATLRKNMKEPYVWGNGKRKGENGKVKAKLRQHEQRTSNEVRTQFVPFGARTVNAGKDERAKVKRLSNNLSTRLLVYLST